MLSYPQAPTLSRRLHGHFFCAPVMLSFTVATTVNPEFFATLFAALLVIVFVLWRVPISSRGVPRVDWMLKLLSNLFGFDTLVSKLPRRGWRSAWPSRLSRWRAVSSGPRGSVDAPSEDGDLKICTLQVFWRTFHWYLHPERPSMVEPARVRVVSSRNRFSSTSAWSRKYSGAVWTQFWQILVSCFWLMIWTLALMEEKNVPVTLCEIGSWGCRGGPGSGGGRGPARLWRSHLKSATHSANTVAQMAMAHSGLHGEQATELRSPAGRTIAQMAQGKPHQAWEVGKQGLMRCKFREMMGSC